MMSCARREMERTAASVALRTAATPRSHTFHPSHKFHLHAQHTTRGFDCDGGASTGVSSRAIKPPDFGVHAQALTCWG